MDKLQLLRDESTIPTPEVIAQALGAANSAYLKFVEGLAERDTPVEWHYYNDSKAWLGKGLYKWTTARGTNKEVTACWLSIWDGFFRVTVFIPEKAREKALAIPLGDEVLGMVSAAKQIGKLKFFPVVFDVCTDELLGDIYTLTNFRKLLK